MDFDVQWDQEHGVARISHTRLVLDSKPVVQAWRERLFSKLEALRSKLGSKFPIVVCIDNFMIRPKVADAYGRVVREMIERYATGVARYGEPSTVKQIIAVEAMKEGFRANLFETFEQAVGYLVLDPSNAPPTSRSQRAIGESSSNPPASRSLRSPAAGGEPTSLRSIPPRTLFKSLTSLPAKTSASEEPSKPLSRRPERITIR
ncbi:MAG: hypothetical protein ABW217_19820 [Polyangiaceae bacterium]